MTFPETPRDIRCELFVGGTWTDISSDVYQRDPITITRGRGERAAQVAPSRCELTLNNRHGRYSPRNPLSPYYGQLGRNTPLRLSLLTITDGFGRTQTATWGTTDTGEEWTRYGSGGTVQASDWSVSSGSGMHAVPATGALRLSALETTQYRNVDVAVTVSVPFVNVTGAQLEPATIALAATAPGSYHMVRVAIATDESISITIRHTNGTVYAGPVTVPGLTHNGGLLRVRAQLEGQTIRAKIWALGALEPYDWHVTATGLTDVPAAGGWIGVRSGVASGNTNPLPIEFAYDNFEVRVPRYAGEVASWPPRWDTSGNDAHISIEAAGIMRRLAQGSPPLGSTMYRGITRLATPPVAYWPAEDGRGATSIGSALGGPPMYVDGAPTFATSSLFDASAALPQLKNSAWVGEVPEHPSTGAIQLRFLLAVPAAGTTDQAILARLRVDGSLPQWDLVYHTGGALSLQAYNLAGTKVLTGGPYAHGINGKSLRVSVEVSQAGGDVNWQFSTLTVGQPTGLFNSGTMPSHHVGRARLVGISPQGLMDDVAVGHVSVESATSGLFTLWRELAAYAGETAGDRLKRLCAEEGVPFACFGDPAATAAMGPQRPGQLTDLIDECVDADLGTLYEPRSTLGLAYRTRESLYNQPAIATIDFAAGELTPPFEPTDDDAATRNDVTAQRTDGSTYRVVLGSGPMSVLDPAAGGAGRYDTSVTVNVEYDSQLPDIASWLVHLGTIDEFRYPKVNVHLARAAVAANIALSRSLLDLDVDDRLVITNAAAAGIYDDISQLARGYRETLLPTDHTLSFTGAPASPYQVLELDNADCRIDSSSSTLTADITSSVLSFLVTSTAELWTTDPAQMPIPITIGGEDMSVTAISGTSSPQTFTVVRSVNGVSKAHGTGTEVHVTRRATLAL